MSKPGQPYQPSNGTDGSAFEAYYCDRCRHGQPLSDRDLGCQIHLMSMACDVDEPDYPREWTYTKEGNPTCTAFQAMPTDEELAEIAWQKRMGRIKAGNKRLELQGQLRLF